MAPMGQKVAGPVTMLFVVGRKHPQMGQALLTRSNQSWRLPGPPELLSNIGDEEKVAPTEAIESILVHGREGKMKILA